MGAIDTAVASALPPIVWLLRSVSPSAASTGLARARRQVVGPNRTPLDYRFSPLLLVPVGWTGGGGLSTGSEEPVKPACEA